MNEQMENNSDITHVLTLKLSAIQLSCVGSMNNLIGDYSAECTYKATKFQCFHCRFSFGTGERSSFYGER